MIHMSLILGHIRCRRYCAKYETKLVFSETSIDESFQDNLICVYCIILVCPDCFGMSQGAPNNSLAPQR